MKFDYLIVGAGSAGCVVANRLSENINNSVAIFEAGGSSDIWKVKMPLALLYTMHDPKYNWKYYSEPEPYLNNRKVFCPRGKMIGGCSSHNGMVFVRGNRDDYTRWENFGLKDWSYEKVLPYFKKIEKWSEGENQFRGSLGPLPVSLSKNKNPLFKAFIDAAAEAGHKTNIDMNGEEQEGFGMFDTTMHQGERAGVAKYYLNPITNRKNLNILKNSFVEKILFDGKKAIGLQVKIKNKVQKIYANKEVILSGGSINSPQLLMLSGIGDEVQLRDNGINVVHDSKRVGKNLQDHLETYIQQKCKTPNTLYTYTKLIPKILAGMQWFMFKSGPCSQSFLEAGGFAKSSPERKVANIQFHFFPSFVINHGLKDPDSHGYQLHASPNHPKSRGEISLNSSDPYDYPRILFNYLKEEEDLKQTRECIKVARKILSQPALSEHAGEEVGPGLDSQSDDELNEYIRSKADTAYHPCGTCKMGVDDMSVVDQNLKVKEIENLRVIDASIIPEIPSANLNAPTLMIAEKGSDYILNS